MTAEEVLKYFEQMDIPRIKEKAILIEQKINDLYMLRNKEEINDKFAHKNQLDDVSLLSDREKSPEK